MRIIGNHIASIILEEGIYKNSQYLIIFYSRSQRICSITVQMDFYQVFLKDSRSSSFVSSTQ